MIVADFTGKGHTQDHPPGLSCVTLQLLTANGPAVDPDAELKLSRDIDAGTSDDGTVMDA